MDVKTFLENLPTIADGPRGVDRLRELVLDLAASGRASEPVDTDIALSIPGMVTAPDRPSHLPAHWEWATLGTIGPVGERATADGPFGSKLRTKDYVEERGFRVLRLGNIGVARFKDTDQTYISEAHFDSLSGYHLHAGDILVASLGNPSGRACLVPTHALPALNKADCFRVRPHPDVDPAYLVAVLNSPAALARAADLNRGDTRGRITLTHLKQVPVPLPPRAEQERIVAKVEELTALCDELERCRVRRRGVATRLRDSMLHALTEADTVDDLQTAWTQVSANWPALSGDPLDVAALRRTVLQLAVRGRLVAQAGGASSASAELEMLRTKEASTDTRRQPAVASASRPDTVIPAGWAWVTVDDLFLVSGGLQKTPRRQPSKNHFPYLRVANVQRGRLDLDQVERFELYDGELERLRLNPGDLLIVEGNGSETEIGRCARWNGEIDDCVHQNHLIRCRPLLPDVEHYLLLFLNSPAGMATMKRLAVTTSGLYNLSVAKIRAIDVPLPPLEEQGRIRDRVERLAALCDDLEHRVDYRQQVQDRLARSAMASVAS